MVKSLAVFAAGGGRRTHCGRCADDQANGFRLRGEGNGLIKNNFLRPLCKRCRRHHVWREAKLWTSRRRRGKCTDNLPFLVLSTVKSEWLRNHLQSLRSADFRMRWLVCLRKDAPEPQERRWVSWGDGRGAGLRQDCDKWVTRRERELQEHVRVCSYGAFSSQELIPDDSAAQIRYRSHYGHVTASTKLDTAHDSRLCQLHSGCWKTDNKDEYS